MTRRKPRVPQEQRLLWFYQHADAAMGIGSNLGPMVAAAVGGWGGSRAPDARMTDARLDAAGRARKVREQLLRLSPEHRLTLWLVYAHHPKVPAQVARHFGMLSMLVLATERARTSYERDAAASKRAKPMTPAEWLLGVCSRGKSGEVDVLEQQAAELLDDALTAWWAL